jgi:uncharacterized protein YijF (DUF1287 family)
MVEGSSNMSERIRNKIIKVGVGAVVFLFIAFFGINKYFYQDFLYFIKSPIEIDNLVIDKDMDRDGVADLKDIVDGARKEAENKTKYLSHYYEGGYPPDDEGVCTDVVIRALKNAGYNLKIAMDQDIESNIKSYQNIDKPDANIDFRRVKNQFVFFTNNTISLTTKVKPFDKKNMSEWQNGDIVVLKKADHVAIISDIRRKDGVPYVIHNSYPHAKENDRLMRWYLQGRIIGHFRYVVK